MVCDGNVDVIFKGLIDFSEIAKEISLVITDKVLDQLQMKED